MSTNHFTPPIKPILAALVVAFILFGTQAKAQLNNMFTDTLNKVLASKATQFDLKGVSAAVVFSDGSVWKQTQGYAGNAQLTPDYLFEMGSNTKTFTAALILLLEEEGKLSIEDTIYKYLQPIKNVTNGITIRQLLSHTSGLFNYTEHPDFFDRINTTNPSAKWNIDTVLATYINPKLANPGQTFAYCNTGFLLLGKIIEKVEGKPYHTVLHEKILSKHNLNHTYLEAYDTYTDTKAETWLTNGVYFDTLFTSFLSSAWSAGGIVATSEDLALWAHKLYNGQVLSPASMDKMITKLKIGNTVYPMGLSVFFNTFLGKLFWGHGGTTLQNSEMEFSVSSKYSVVVVCNQQNTYTEALTIKRAIEQVLENTLPPLSVQENTTTTPINIYPNPAHGTINISFGQELPHTVNIYNTAGQLVQQYRSTANSLQLQTQEIGTGIFIVEAANAQGSNRQRIVLY